LLLENIDGFLTIGGGADCVSFGTQNFITALNDYRFIVNEKDVAIVLHILSIPHV
jgi:hypothetical protein